MGLLNEERLRAARAAIAAGRSTSRMVAQLGTVTLREDQCLAVSRTVARLEAHRGCLLADEVGRGKTFVALAVARRWRSPIVVLPAALRDTWRDAMQRAGVAIPLITHEALSRSWSPSHCPDGVILDESHHFRSPGIRRYAALADLCARSELLMLSATPVQNGVRDLRAQLALFLGSAASTMSEAVLVSHVIRSTGSEDIAGMPSVAPPRWVPSGVDDADVLHAILDLPAPPRALDAGDAGALRTLALVRAWASSRAALVSALATRRRTVTAIEQSLEVGRLPTRTELRTWYGAGDESIQLGFAALLASAPSGAAVPALARAVAMEHEALDRLSALLRARPQVDALRADYVRRIVRAHPGERVLAFTELASTARAYFALLRGEPEVAVLTAGEARLASGRISRRDLLARFAPHAMRVAPPPPRERIALLISTDLLSEGVNLQDASVVIHLDLPWNPARLAQRVGRVRRPSAARRVSAYLLAPPASTAVLIEIEGRLRRKLAAADSTVGRSLEVIPALTLEGLQHVSATRHSLVEAAAHVQRRLDAWVAGAPHDGALICAGVGGCGAGWLALLSDGRLLGSLDDGLIRDDVHTIDELTARCEGVACGLDAVHLEGIQSDLHRHLARERLMAECGVSAEPTPVAAAVERHALRLLRRTSRVARSARLAQLAMLRSALQVPLSLGTERALVRLTERSHAPDDFFPAALEQVGSVRHQILPRAPAVPTVVIVLGGSG